MAWITLTASDLQKRVSAAEYAKVQTLAANGAESIASVLLNVTHEIRGYVAAGGYTMGAGDTIPQELSDAAIAIARVRLLTLLPDSVLLTKERGAEADCAFELLKGPVLEGAFGIADPATPSTDTSATIPGPSTAPKDRNFTAAGQEGIA